MEIKDFSTPTIVNVTLTKFLTTSEDRKPSTSVSFANMIYSTMCEYSHLKNKTVPQQKQIWKSFTQLQKSSYHHTKPHTHNYHTAITIHSVANISIKTNIP